MSSRGHDTYRESGTEWLGEVPAHWKTVPLRGLARPGRTSFIDGDWIESPYITDEGVRLIQTGNIGVGIYREQGFRYISEQTFDELNCTAVEPGDVLICRLAEPVGRACLAPKLPDRMITSVDVCILKPATGVNTRFIVYLLSSPDYLGYMEGQCRGGTRDRVSRSFLGGVRLGLPPADEQTAIAAFLDRETSKIDALVEEQKRLIDLLKEQRQATIAHAVTKGLNPDAPMKDSGVKWLGEVPAHWEVQPMRRYLSYLTSGSRGWAGYYSDDGAVFIRIGNLTRDSIDLDLTDVQRVSVPPGAEGERTQVRPGDLLFSITAYLGSVAVVPPEMEPSYVSQHVALARVSPEFLYPEWVALVTLSIVGQTYLAEQGYGGTKIQLSLDDVKGLLLTVPPKDEQRVIIGRIRAAEMAFRSLQGEAEATITLLQERRAALISAAVTGKIDVRGISARTQIDRSRLRMILGATIIEAIAQKPGSGRTKTHKITYLAETHAGIQELHGSYTRQAAGPLDWNMITETEAQLQSNGHITAEQPDGHGTFVTYRVVGQRHVFRDELRNALGSRAEAVNRLITDLADLDTKSVEAIATLYAVWNDALIDGAHPTDGDIIAGVLNDWHPDKKKKFTANELQTWLAWMRRHHLVPKGQGPRTQLDRLFA